MQQKTERDTSQKIITRKDSYKKPILTHYGSITQLTAGAGGSTRDLSDPFSTRSAV